MTLPDRLKTSAPNQHRVEWVLALAVTLGLVLLHLYFFLHRGGFWRDEVDLINLSAQQNPLEKIRPDSFPVLMSVVIRGWAELFGGSDQSLQSLGLIIGLSGVGALWAAGYSLHRSPPLIGLVLFGLNSQVISYSQTLRAYGLGCALIIAYLAALWTYLRNPSAGRLLLLLALALLSVQALFQNAVLIAAISVGAWLVCLRRRQFVPAAMILLVGGAAAISLKPYLKDILSSQASSAATFLEHPRAWRDFLPAIDLAEFPLAGYRYVWAALVVISIFNAFLRLRTKSPTMTLDDEVQFFGGATALGSLIGFVWFFHAVNAATYPWHFLPLLAVLAPLLSLVPLPSTRLARTTIFGLILATALISSGIAYRDLQVRFSNVDVVATKLKALASDRDYILVTPWYCGITYNRYHIGTAPWDTIPPVTNHWSHEFPLVEQFMVATNPLASVKQKISTTLQNGGRVWIVGDVEIPEIGIPAPADLPPPPHWLARSKDTPFNLIWDRQLAHFIRDHSQRFKEVQLGLDQPVNALENLPLRVAEGWRDDIASPPPVVLPIK